MSEDWSEIEWEDVSPPHPVTTGEVQLFVGDIDEL